MSEKLPVAPAENGTVSPPPYAPEPAVPSYRLREEAEKARAALAEAATWKQKYEEASTWQQKHEALQQTHTRALTHHQMQAHLLSLGAQGRQKLLAPTVQQALIRSYEEATTGQEKPPPFPDWLSSLSDDPLFGHLLAPQADPRTTQIQELLSRETTSIDDIRALLQPSSSSSSTTPDLAALLRAALGIDTGQSRTTPGGDPNAATGQPAIHAGRRYTADEIEAIRARNGGRLPPDIRARYLAQLRADGLIR